jgi:hypothetical protein
MERGLFKENALRIVEDMRKEDANGVLDRHSIYSLAATCSTPLQRAGLWVVVLFRRKMLDHHVACVDKT